MADALKEVLQEKARTGMPVVYLCIGNTDGKLTMQEWGAFIKDITEKVTSFTAETMVWFSDPEAPWVSACWMLSFETLGMLSEAQEAVIAIRKQYRQDSVAWTFAPETRFI